MLLNVVQKTFVSFGYMFKYNIINSKIFENKIFLELY